MQPDPVTKTPENQPDTPRPWLRRFCALTIIATFSLIAIGGHVTSTDVGLAVPDGFTTFGHNTLLAPLEVWWYDFGTRWEHGHRLKGNVVGMMTIVMAIWLFVTQRNRPVLRWSGVAMLILVSSQGIMGALRVSEISLTFAFIHGIVGQCILCCWIVILAALSKPWLVRLGSIAKKQREQATPRLRWAVRILLVLLLCQLTLGSAVRHFKADKAIPDFPLTYGKVLPPMFQESLDERYIAYYTEQAIQTGKPVKDGQITNVQKSIEMDGPESQPVVSIAKLHLQLWHRIGAIVVCTVGLGIIIACIRRARDRSVVIGPAMTLLLLLATQFALGIVTVLTKTDPLMATLHQATGAALIAVATWLAVRIHLAEYQALAAVTAPATQSASETASETAPVTTTQADPEPKANPSRKTPAHATATA